MPFQLLLALLSLVQETHCRLRPDTCQGYLMPICIWQKLRTIIIGRNFKGCICMNMSSKIGTKLAYRFSTLSYVLGKISRVADRSKVLCPLLFYLIFKRAILIQDMSATLDQKVLNEESPSTTGAPSQVVPLLRYVSKAQELLVESFPRLASNLETVEERIVLLDRFGRLTRMPSLNEMGYVLRPVIAPHGRPS